MTERASKYAACSSCGVISPVTHDGLLDNGWVMYPYRFGYYSGFSDAPDDDHDELRWDLCHYCVVRFFELFPGLAASHPKQQHPCNDDEPCCAFAWKWKDGAESEPLGVENGHWAETG